MRAVRGKTSPKQRANRHVIHRSSNYVKTGIKPQFKRSSWCIEDISMKHIPNSHNAEAMSTLKGQTISGDGMLKKLFPISY